MSYYGALGGSLALVALSYMSPEIYGAPGGVTVGVAAIVLTYEIIMIVLIFVNSVNHRIRFLMVSVAMFILIEYNLN